MAVSWRERESADSSSRLADAIEPVLEQALRSSIRNNPRVLAELLAPAIRICVATAVRDRVESLSRFLRDCFSPKALVLRLEAWRTGRSYAEARRLASLVHLVEHVLLIHRRTRLLLARVQDPAVPERGNLIVSGVLTSIQDLVEQSCNSHGDGARRTMDSGEFTVWLDQARHTSLAVVVRGVPPAALRSRMAAVLAAIEQRHARDLASFEGDTHPFDRCRPLLEECLSAEYRALEKPGRAPLWIAAGVLGALALFWLFTMVRASNQLSSAAGRLRAEPGIVVVSAERSGGRLRIAGLRDPLAEDPSRILARSGVDPAKVDATWRAYWSLDPAIAAKRAALALRPPATVTLSASDGVLEMRGTAPHAWIAGALKSATSLPGVDRVRIAALDDAEMEANRAVLESLEIRLVPGASALSEAGIEAARRAAASIASMQRAGREISRSVRVVLQGDSGQVDVVRKELTRAGVSPDLLAPGPGSKSASGPVTFAVTFGEGAER